MVGRLDRRLDGFKGLIMVADLIQLTEISIMVWLANMVFILAAFMGLLGVYVIVKHLVFMYRMRRLDRLHKAHPDPLYREKHWG